MDTGEGRFELMKGPEDEGQIRKQYPKSGSVFSVGEVVEIKESRFRIVDISSFGLKLKLLRKD